MERDVLKRSVVCCAASGSASRGSTSGSTGPATPRQVRRGELDAEVCRLFVESRRSYGSPARGGRGWTVNTVADSMRRQGLQGRKPKHSKGLTHHDKKAAKFPDLLKRDLSVPAQT